MNAKEERSRIIYQVMTLKDFLSISTWKEITTDVRQFFLSHEDIFKITGFCIAIAGLLLNLHSDDIYLRRLVVFFLVASFSLLSFFILKSIIYLVRGKHTELFSAVTLIPIFIGAVLIFNISAYLKNNFIPELIFYGYIIAIPILALVVNLSFLLFFGVFSKLKKIEGSQVEIFFLFILNTHLLSVYLFSDQNFTKTLHKLISSELNNFVIVYLFFLILWSEMHPLKSETRIEAIVKMLAYGFFLTLPYLINFIIPLIIQ